jgi:hypothetical protein
VKGPVVGKGPPVKPVDEADQQFVIAKGSEPVSCLNEEARLRVLTTPEKLTNLYVQHTCHQDNRAAMLGACLQSITGSEHKNRYSPDRE